MSFYHLPSSLVFRSVSPKHTLRLGLAGSDSGMTPRVWGIGRHHARTSLRLIPQAALEGKSGFQVSPPLAPEQSWASLLCVSTMDRGLHWALGWSFGHSGFNSPWKVCQRALQMQAVKVRTHIVDTCYSLKKALGEIIE